MAIKFATDIINEIKARGSINVPQGYITGEAFEKWLYQDDIFIVDTTSTHGIVEEYIDLDYGLSILGLADLRDNYFRGIRGEDICMKNL